MSRLADRASTQLTESAGWNFIWSRGTSSCQQVNVTILGGNPPWSLVLAPIGGRPVFWDIAVPTDYDPLLASYVNIPVPFPSGTEYIVFGYDGTGVWADHDLSTELQVVGTGNDKCFSDTVFRPRDFSFSVSGQIESCSTGSHGFEVSWDDEMGEGPYNMTILSLDASYPPFDVPLIGGRSTIGDDSWNVNMTTGTRFTIMMNNGLGRGRGGMGEIYQVQGSKTSCLSSIAPSDTVHSTSAYVPLPPTKVITNSPVSPVDGETSSANSNRGRLVSDTPARDNVTSTSISYDDSGSPNGLSTAAAAGIGAAVATAVLLIGIAFIGYYLHKRPSAPSGGLSRYNAVDLIDSRGPRPFGVNSIEPRIEPFRTSNTNSPPSLRRLSTSRSPTCSPGGYSETILRPLPTSPSSPSHVAQCDPHVGSPTSPSQHSAVRNPRISQKRPDARSMSISSQISRTSVLRSSASSSTPMLSTMESLKLAALEKSPRASMQERRRSEEPRRPPSESEPEYRRHTDAGVSLDGERRVIDLPPLYDDVPRQ
ncbi:hypothetical protein M231_02312 [Tremella mesenterica]|uniref:Mid2 domain-containing protein n=1 Tax=Tremella mesenterica TaxID=5217 RepID=A0A4Q1BRC4_TREME|nr:uncharacterized protein TREMEDRAFT_65377 [Tremella mesenterica DSM 1558]EIW66510.1 hypothetical protein TREMEDRAFT_65377 [Tremella mesenterica DSM 1558]RXK40479.1 hypothetical protein M231_02312 [Tremella mesenterica]